MFYIIKANKKNSKSNKSKLNVDEFTRAARKELIKYATCLWDKHLYSKYDDPNWGGKIDTVDELHCILDKINCSDEKPNLIKFSSQLVEFRSVLADFESILAKKKKDGLFIAPLSFITHFFKLSPGIAASLQEPSRAKLLVKNLVALVEKAQESIYLASSTQELCLAYSAFGK
jgi:hypothetical protein